MTDAGMGDEAMKLGLLMEAAQAQQRLGQESLERLAAHAQDQSVAQELSFWRGMQREPSLLLAEDRLDPVRDTLGTAWHLTLTLPSAVTDALLTRVPAAFHGGIDDVLLTGLTLAVGLVPAACPGRPCCHPSWRQPCGAARPRRPWS